jgi:hypothetical protein
VKRNMSKKLSIIALTCILSLVAVTAIASAQDEYPWGEDWDPFQDSSEAAAGWALFGLGLLCILPIIWLIIAILIAIWVYRDAEKRGSSGVLWLIIVILTGIIGLIIWLVVRPPVGGAPKQAAVDRRCPNCGRAIPMDAKACPYCAKKFDE